MDECILCLWRLQKNNYKSVFDEEFFAEYKRIHDLYGTVFVLSLHFTQLEEIAWNAPFPKEMKGWSIDKMPDTWKKEFEYNSDWLKFSYHTYAFEYKYTTPQKIAERNWEQDIVDMEREVKRFAGENAWSCLFAKTHGVCGDKKLIDIFMHHGTKFFEGDAEHVELLDNNMQSYYLNDRIQNKMFRNGTWYDKSKGALFFAGAGNIERLYGFISGGDKYKNSIDMDEYMDRFTNDSSYFVHKTCDYLTFCSHESPMIDGVVILCNNVKPGDTLELNGNTYTADKSFKIGNNDIETAKNLWNSLVDIPKFQIRGNLLVVYAKYGKHSDSFILKTTFGEIEILARWCKNHGWIPKHIDFDSFCID